MKIFLRYLKPFVAVALFFSGSCSSISMHDLQSVQRGMSTKDLFLMLERNPYNVFTVIDPEDGLEYEVRIFFMVTGTVTTYSPGYFIGDAYIPGGYETHAVHEDYAFLFLEDSLLFWGFLHEFARSDDQRIRRVAPMIIEESKKDIQKGFIQ